MQPLVTVKPITKVHILLTLRKNPVRGMTQAECLEAECFEVLGRDEMVHCGSRWRFRIAQEPCKLERVLADVRCQQQEGIAIRNAGAYAEDLWRRFV